MKDHIAKGGMLLHHPHKPKGSAGGATMLNLIYSMADDTFLPTFENPMTEALFRFTASASASRAVCARRRIIASLSDQSGKINEDVSR